MAQSIGRSDYATGGVGLSARLAVSPQYIMEIVGSFSRGRVLCVRGTRLIANLHLVRRLRVLMEQYLHSPILHGMVLT
jgi:hypothetical protein